MKVAKKKIDKAIVEIIQMKFKYCKPDTIIIARALDKALSDIGWGYASLLKIEKETK